MSDGLASIWGAIHVSQTLSLDRYFDALDDNRRQRDNALVLGEMERLRQGWDNSVRQHNALVDSYNQLARKAAADAARVKDLERQVANLQEDRTILDRLIQIYEPAFRRQQEALGL